MNRAALLKVAGVVLIVSGVWSAAWGVRHLSELPMLHSWKYYGTSRQLSSISGGVALIVLGWWAYRTGKTDVL
jgi:hypothetical protein